MGEDLRDREKREDQLTYGRESAGNLEGKETAESRGLNMKKKKKMNCLTSDLEFETT